MTDQPKFTFSNRPHVFDGAGEALDAARAHEAGTLDWLDYETRLHGEGYAVFVFNSSPREALGYLVPAEAVSPSVEVVRATADLDPSPYSVLWNGGYLCQTNTAEQAEFVASLLRPRLPAPNPSDGLRDALQWLLDDLHDADQTHGEDGEIFDSVEDSAAALIEAGGALNWYSAEDARAYRARQAGAPGVVMAGPGRSVVPTV